MNVKGEPMKTRRLSIVMLACAGMALSLVGCAGEAARTNVLGPTMLATWPGVKEDAELGLAARQNAQAAQALNVQVISPGVAASRQERINQFDAAVRTFTHSSP